MASIDLCPIDDCSLEAATSMLVRGFPERNRAFWVAALQRLLTIRGASSDRPIGYLMTVGDKNAGVVLTIPSQQPNGAGITNIVHLAAWYIEAPHRWLAIQMMKKVLADKDTVFLDMTPNQAAQVINEKLGFTLLNEGFLIYLLPATALRANGPAQMLSFAKAAPLLSLPERIMLEQHQALGCIVGALRSGSKLSPMIFSRMTRRGLPGARLILADSKMQVTDNLASISRFLLRQGTLFLRMDASRSDSAAGSFAARWTEPTYIKGAHDRAQTNFSYSEFVFLGT